MTKTTIEAVDNFDSIRELLSWNNEDEYYYCQILLRKKDGTTKFANKNNNARLVKAYCIKSLEEFDFYRPEIIKLCEASGARAGINLNKKSERKMLNQMLLNVAERSVSRQYSGINNLSASLNGITKTNVDPKNRIYLIDVDDLNDIPKVEEALSVQGNSKTVPQVVKVVPTYTGCHYIMSKFDTETFMKIMKENNLDVCIHKNNPIALYYPLKQEQ